MPDAPRPGSPRTVVLAHEGLRELKGFTQIPNFILRHAKLSFGAKVAFGVLPSYAWQEDFCRPAQERLGRDLHCTDRWVRKLLSELKAAGFLIWKQQGLNRPNLYILLPNGIPSSVAPPPTKARNGTSSPDRNDPSGPERNSTSVQERNSASAYKYPKKKTQNTRVEIALNENAHTPHLELVAYFHRKAGHPEEQAAIPKELVQAKDLLMTHAPDTCRTIVDFALAKAAETNFKMRHFGAVLAYVPEALAVLERTRTLERRAADDHRRREEEDTRIAAERDAYFNLPPEERFAQRLTRRIAVFKTLERSEPTPEEIEDLRHRLSSDEATTT